MGGKLAKVVEGCGRGGSTGLFYDDCIIIYDDYIIPRRFKTLGYWSWLSFVDLWQSLRVVRRPKYLTQVKDGIIATIMGINYIRKSNIVGINKNK